jgi:hypothetical protein
MPQTEAYVLEQLVQFVWSDPIPCANASNEADEASEELL